MKQFRVYQLKRCASASSGIVAIETVLLIGFILVTIVSLMGIPSLNQAFTGSSYQQNSSLNSTLNQQVHLSVILPQIGWHVYEGALATESRRNHEQSLINMDPNYYPNTAVICFHVYEVDYGPDCTGPLTFNVMDPDPDCGVPPNLNDRNAIAAIFDTTQCHGFYATHYRTGTPPFRIAMESTPCIGLAPGVYQC